MKKREPTQTGVIVLAYLHRYGWVAILFALIFLLRFWEILYIGFIVHAVWSFVGYKCKWKHIFCSYQNAYHQKMTPDSIKWSSIKKSDAYGIPLIFLTLGVLALIFA